MVLKNANLVSKNNMSRNEHNLLLGRCASKRYLIAIFKDRLVGDSLNIEHVRYIVGYIQSIRIKNYGSFNLQMCNENF